MSINPLHTMLPTQETTDVYTDLTGLQRLKASSRKNAQAALPEVARQFESVMISMMIKNLRNTGLEDPIFSSQAMDSYRDMYDKQLGLELSKGQGFGFAKTIVEQMKYQSPEYAEQATSNNPDKEAGKVLPQRRHFYDHYASNSPAVASQISTENKQTTAEFNNDEVNFDSPEQFVERLWPLAEKTAKQLGISAEVIISQAALETGWGKHVISDGKTSSYNLFNIKADRDWSGKRIEKLSTEFISGSPVKQKSDFRAYDSYEQSFADYAQFIQTSQRYSEYSDKLGEISKKSEQSLHDTKYIKGIHKAGYATDPAYSDKVLDVMRSNVIQNQKISHIKLVSK